MAELKRFCSKTNEKYCMKPPDPTKYIADATIGLEKREKKNKRKSEKI